MPTLSYYTLFDSSTIELPKLGDLSFTYHINSVDDYAIVNTEWLSFVEDYLTIPLELDFKLDYIWISGVSYGDIEPWVNGDMSCTESSKVTPLVESLTSAIAVSQSTVCNNVSLAASPSGQFCINCANRCFDPKNGTLSLPVNDSCFDWEWDSRITKHAVAISFSSQDKIRLTVPSVENLRLTPFKNKIVVSAVTRSTEGGTWYCNAFNTLQYTGTSFLSRSLLRTKGFASPVVGSQSGDPLELNITITNLVAASNYAVYCHVEDTSGYKASYDSMILTKTLTTTKCCRNIKMTKVSKYLTASETLQTVRFGYNIPSFPESGLSVTVTPYITHSSNAFASLINVKPKSFTFTSNNKNLGRSRSFVLSAPLSTPDGDYALHFNVSDEATKSSLRFKYLAPSPIGFEVLGGSSPLPPPTLSTALFSNSGQSVSVCFDGSTDYGINELQGDTAEEWICNRIFSFSGDDVTSCTWTSDTCVKMIFCGNSLCGDDVNRKTLLLLEPDEYVYLKAGVVKSACRSGTTCSLNKFAPTVAIAVSTSLFALQPNVFVFASAVGGACDSPLVLDASASSGNGGRPWRSILWTVSIPELSTGSSPNLTVAQEIEYAALATYLNNYDSIDAPITVPFDMFQSTSYRFSLSVANFLDIGSVDYTTASVDVTVIDAASSTTPSVNFDGPFVRTVRAFDDFSVGAIATLPSCLESSAIVYTWKVYKENRYAPEISSLSSDSRKMTLDPYTLEADSTYYFYVTATVDNGGKGFALLTVYVEPGSIYVSISGASSFVVPHGTPLTLDASSSVLEDLSPLDPANVVALSWWCDVSDVPSSDAVAVFGDSCDNLLQVNASANGTIPSTKGVPILTEILEAGVEYTVYASAIAASGDEIIASVSFRSLPSLIVLPTITITSTFKKFNADRILQIFGVIDTPAAAAQQNVSWVMYDDSGNTLELEQLLMTSNSKVVQPNNSYTFALGAKPLSFTPGKAYTFRLLASSPDVDEETFSQITLTANGAPTSGQFVVSPTTGSALETTFFFNAPFWLEDASDYPIAYSFRYTLKALAVNVSGITYMNIGFASQRSYRYTQLPAGLPSQNSTVFGVVQISDFYGSSTEAYVNITVEEKSAVVASDFTRRLSEYNFSANMQTAMSQGNVDGVSIEINNVLAALIAADCSSVPNCAATFNRQECYAVPHTCGPCLDGYTGAAGGDNSVCFLEGDENITFPETKSCPSATRGAQCSGRGECFFLDTTTGVQLMNCSHSDSACMAMCRCHEGSHGFACDFSEQDFDDRMTTRELLCEGLTYVGDNMDESTELLLSIATTLQFAFNPYEVRSIDSFKTCLNVVDDIVSMSNNGFLANEPFYISGGLVTPHQAILDFTSDLMEYTLITETGNNTNVTETNILLEELASLVNSLTSSISSNMVGGESDLEVVSNGFSISVMFASLEDLQNATLHPPSTSADIMYGRDVPSVILPASGMKACSALSSEHVSDSEYVRLSLSNWQTNPYVVSSAALSTNDTLSSSILRFASVGSSEQISSVVATGESPSFDTNYTLVLIWNVEQAWNTTENYPGITSFLPDGSLAPSPCQYESATSTSVTFTCFNLLDLCPAQNDVSNSTTNRRLEMGSGGSDEVAYPTLYPDHPHYSFWSAVKLHHFKARRLDFDYAGESDDDTSGTVSYVDYGALITSASSELTTTLTSNPNVLAEEQGLSVLIGLVIVFSIFLMCLHYFVMWDRRDRKKLYEVPVGKRTAFSRTQNESHFVLKPTVADDDIDANDDGVISMRLSPKRDMYDSNQIIGAEDSLARGVSSFQRSQVSDSKTRQQNINAAVNNFLDATVPFAFSKTNKSGWGRFFKAVCRQHNWVRCFTYGSRRLPRWIRFLIVMTDIMLLMFVDALFFGLMFVDDGYCEGLSGEGNIATCEDAPSKMQSGLPYCHFDTQTHECTLRPPPADITFFLIVAMLVTVFSILPSVFCEHILRTVCARTPCFQFKGDKNSKIEMNLAEIRRNVADSLMAYMSLVGTTVTSVAMNPWATSDANDHEIPVSSVLPESRMHEVNTYIDSCTLEEEVNVLTESARSAIQYNLVSRAMPWSVRSLSTDDGVDRAAALKNIIGLHDDGSPVPLTTFQKFRFGTARQRLETKVRKVRNRSDAMMADVDVFLQGDKGCVDHINAYLIQSFIMEQLSPFRRYAVMEEFFQFDDADPVPVNLCPWLISWGFMILLWSFLTYWCLMWSVSNSRLTATSWGLQMVFVLVQEGFVNENMQVLIRNVLVVETLRAQVNRIVDVLNSVLVTKVIEMEEKGDIKVEGFNVAQHMSASCRVARKPVLCNLVASKVLMLINDHDVALCREARLTRISFLTKLVITVPSLLAFSHESVQQCFLDVFIPTVWCCFVFANAVVWQVSPALLFVPYVLLACALLYRYGYVLPRRRRRRQYDQAGFLEQHKSLQSSDSLFRVEEYSNSEDIMWRNMNLSLALTSREEYVPLPVKEFSFLRSTSTCLDIPSEVADQKVKTNDTTVFYEHTEQQESGFAKLVNDRVWKVDDDFYREEFEDGELDDRKNRGWLNDEWNVVFGSFKSKRHAPLITSQSVLSLPPLKPAPLKTSKSMSALQSPGLKSPPPLTRKLAKSGSSPSRGYIRQSELNKQGDISASNVIKATAILHPMPPDVKPLQATHSLSRMRTSPSVPMILKPSRSLKKMVSQSDGSQVSGSTTTNNVDMRLLALSTRYQSKRQLMDMDNIIETPPSNERGGEEGSCEETLTAIWTGGVQAGRQVKVEDNDEALCRSSSESDQGKLWDDYGKVDENNSSVLKASISSPIKSRNPK